VQRWLFFQAAHVTPACVPLFRATNRRVQEFWQTEGDAQAADAAREEPARWLPVLKSPLAGREWLEGVFSLADVAYAPHLWLIVEGGFEGFAACRDAPDGCGLPKEAANAGRPIRFLPCVGSLAVPRRRTRSRCSRRYQAPS
jgi:glutathione S-transferase